MYRCCCRSASSGGQSFGSSFFSSSSHCHPLLLSQASSFQPPLTPRPRDSRLRHRIQAQTISTTCTVRMASSCLFGCLWTTCPPGTVLLGASYTSSLYPTSFWEFLSFRIVSCVLSKSSLPKRKKSPSRNPIMRSKQCQCASGMRR